MPEFDFSKLTFLFHIRLDTEERLWNLKYITRFYRRHAQNVRCIFCEDDPCEAYAFKELEIGKDDLYIYRKGDHQYWNKCTSFNIGLKHVKTPYTVFHDLDAIIHPQQFIETIEAFEEDPKNGIIFPYSGEFLCVNKDIKHEFGKTLDYNDLDKYYPKHKQINYNDGNVLYGHNNSVGGCCVGRTESVLAINGYNPNFKGWGYEDNEFPKRMHILGYGVSRITGDRKPLWHLPHEGKGASLKAENPFYEENRVLCGWVETQSKATLQGYIKEWTL